MSISNVTNTQTYSKFFSPVLEIISSCEHHRICTELSDSQWIQMGVCRAIMEVTTGRGFLQRYNPYFNNPIDPSHFFTSLKSDRRLNFCQEVNDRLCQGIQERLPDPLAQYQELKKFDLYAGDGHWHGPACHDKIKDGRKWAVGHFYSLNLRTHAIKHLEMADEVARKHEHDMRALKRQSIQALRQGAAKGRKVLYAWDSACLDFEQWQSWKDTGGVYFITRAKENMVDDYLDDRPFDSENPVNHGIISDQIVQPNAGKSIRRIECRDPATGEVHVFITNEMTLPPGLLAQIYRMRWDVEKTYDEFKNQFGELKAWASSSTAKTMQAHFLCLAHNLVLLMDHELEQSFSISNQAELKRKQARLENLIKTATKAGRKISNVYQNVQRFTKRSVKLLRSLQTYFFLNAPLADLADYLRKLYATL